ncbi:MAG: hypothetical protein AAB740_01315 [Patescibacteria group bacterium]
MFDEINNQNLEQTNVPTPEVGFKPNLNQRISAQAEDILNGVDQPDKPAVFQPKPTSSADYDKDNKKSGATDSNKFFVLGAIVIGFILIICVGYFGIKFYLNFRASNKTVLNNTGSSVTPPTPTPTPTEPTAFSTPTTTATSTVVSDIDSTTEPTSTSTSTLASTPTSTEPMIITPMIITPQQPIDSDQDGLTDEEEKQLGTDPYSSDSDNDGLSDREEVKVYGTNPFNVDTDGDGYSDGAEVKNGYNPKGLGKL